MAQHSRAKSIVALAKQDVQEDFIENSCSKPCGRDRPSRAMTIHPSFLRVKRKIDFDNLPNNDDSKNTDGKKKKIEENSMERQQNYIEEDDSHTTIQEEYFYASIIPPRPVAVLVEQDDVTSFENPSVLTTSETVPSASKQNTFILGLKDGAPTLELSKENKYRPEKAAHEKVFIITSELFQDAQQAADRKKENIEENYMNRQATKIKKDDRDSTLQQEEYFYAIITPPRPAAVLVDQDDDVTSFESPSVLTTLETMPSASKPKSFNLDLQDRISTLELSNEKTSCPEEDTDGNVSIFCAQQATNGPGDDDVIQDQSRKSRPKKGRKLKYDSQNRMTRKMNVIQNKSYYTQRGTFKEPKQFRQYMCKCDCINTIGVETAQREFQKFYSVDSHAAQRALICAMVTEEPIKRKRKKISDKKTCTRLYKIDEKKVCKMFFVQTFRISSDKITSALKCKKRPEGVKDLRGKGGGYNKTKQVILNAVIDHIQKFPKYKSHYRRAQTEMEYLAPHTTLKVMYNCYKHETSDHERVSEATYKKVFYTNFNLRRKKLKKDTCNTCDKLEVLISNESGATKDNVIKEKNEHCEKAETVRKAMNRDIENSKSDPETEVLTFDLEKTLPMPRIPTNVVFYLRQLWLYNAGIYSGKSNKSFSYVWVEGEAGRGAQEVGSCLMKHILSEQFPKVKNLILWSDSCGGQNRNIKIVLIMKSILEQHPTLETITLNYLIPGHSYLQNDNDFGDIEKALKLQQRLYTPQDYMQVMANCRKKNPIKTIKMEKTDFISTEKMEKAIVNRKKDNMGEKVNWLKIRQIKITKDHPFKINFKTTVDEEEESVEIDVERKKGKKGQTCFKDLVIPLWPNGKPVSEKKLKDLKSLFPYIPNDSMSFYRNLISDDTIDDDIEGFDGHLDFDPEHVEEE